MARMLGFGQPTGVIAQAAYVVADIRKAITFYQEVLGCGPFFLLEHIKSDARKYRGKTYPGESSVAMSFSGHLNIELIAVHDTNPSVQREAIERWGYGFHHYGIAYEDVEAELPRYLEQGYVEVSRNAVPTGGEVVFLDPPDPVHPGYLELLPVTEQMDATFTRFWQAAQNWDGSDPIRPFM